jgi:hypothetical protein
MKFKELFDEISQQTTETMLRKHGEGPVDLRSCEAGERTRTGEEADVKYREKNLKIIINI